jgi:hypothetical protein
MPDRNFNPEINTAIDTALHDPTRENIEGVALAALTYTAVEAAWWRVKEAYKEYKQAVESNLAEALAFIEKDRPS